jgi:multiple sugar transport system permease protein
VTVPAQMALGMLLALLLNAKIKGRVAFRTLYYLPVITSWVVVSLVFRYLFNPDAGAINYLLVDVLGLVDSNIVWLGDRWTALAAIMVLGIWKGMGWSMLVFLAALQGVPKELMEAAEIDGASRSRRFFSVTLPMLRPVVMFVTIMLIIGGFNVFISVFLMTGGGPAQQTEVLLTYMYNQAFQFLEFGYAAAIAYCVTVLILGISLVQHKLFRGGEVA